MGALYPITSPTGNTAPRVDCPPSRAFAHAVQFYSGEDFLLETLSRYVATALGAGDAALVIATEPHREELERRLRARRMRLGVALAEGRYIQLDAAATLSTFMVDGILEEKLFAKLFTGVLARASVAAEGEHPRIAVFGEMVALLWAQGQRQAALRLEQLWTGLARAHSVSVLCAHPMAGFERSEDHPAFLQICGEHGQVLPAEGYTGLRSKGARLRTITDLQQKAEALKTERSQRQQIERSLQLRESELADLLENSVEGVQRVGGDQRVLWANQSLLNLLGYTPEEYIGRSLVEIHVRAETFEEFWRKLMRRENIYDFPAELRCKDGSVKQVLIHSNGLWDGDRFVHTRCFIRDVTEQKRLQEFLRRSEKMAATGRLAATIAHEINNPLESLTNLLYLLQQSRSLDGAARNFASLADRELRRIAHITRQMLGFYRESTHPTPFNLRDALDGVLEMYEPRLSSRNILVHREYRAEGELQGYPSELRQLFANLIGNAIEAVGAEGIIRVRLYESQDWTNGQRGLRVAIADSGCGIPESIQRGIFEPFFTTKGESGTGLGLWVSRGIVLKHEGAIRFRSTCNRDRSGTVFSVFLPVAEVQQTYPQTEAAKLVA